MSTKRSIGNEVIQSMEDAIDYMQGKKKRSITHKVVIPESIDVTAIRKKLNLSRSSFANCFGFSARTVQHWEQGDRRPQGAARILLVLLQREPETIERILRLEEKPKTVRHKRVAPRAHVVARVPVRSKATHDIKLHKKKIRKAI